VVFLVSHVGNTQNPKKLFESFQENSLNFINTLVLKISTMEIENILVFFNFNVGNVFTLWLCIAKGCIE
jgi:hypothetical protein